MALLAQLSGSGSNREGVTPSKEEEEGDSETMPGMAWLKAEPTGQGRR